jgi:hypothetical protein
MGRLAEKQECNGKKCHVRAPSIYGGEFMGAGLLWLRFGHGKQKLYGVRGCMGEWFRNI